MVRVSGRFGCDGKHLGARRRLVEQACGTAAPSACRRRPSPGTSTPARRWSWTCGLGPTSGTVDSIGMVASAPAYDVYGEPTVTGSLGNEFDFAGQQTDPSTGLQYLRARYYDPVSGNFMSRDPAMASRPGWVASATGYGDSNPVTFSDPSGMYPWDNLGNEVETEWCLRNPRNAAQCFEVGQIASQVASLLREYFGANADIDGTKANAFKHCCWMGLTALKFGYEAAWGFGLRHEL